MKIAAKLCIALIAFPISALAQIPAADILVQRLSSCDAQFFRAIKDYDSALKNLGPLIYKDEIAYWKVPDRKNPENSAIMFSTPIDGSVKLIGYSDDVIDLQSEGIYYTWGFLAKGTPDSVAGGIKHLIEDGARLRKDGGAYVRSEIRHMPIPNSQWEKNDTLASGVVPKENTVERVFLLDDAGDQYPGMTRIVCSLQGGVSPLLISTERPDIDQ